MTKHKAASLTLTMTALGVVFGDIGTSPLYALQAVFSLSHLTIDAQTVYGIISLIIWSIAIVVSLKYVWLIMNADNNGEGGIMSLVALLRKAHLGRGKTLAIVLLGFVGLSLFYGDSIITPAISVLSAVEGVKVAAPSLEQYIVPITVVILALLFALQSRGTSTIGKLFGPVMILWFGASAAGGVAHIIQNPAVLMALLPSTAFQFAISYPGLAFVSMGAVILAITGAEALYADMGHFGKTPIRRAWFYWVFPALILNYLGQGAMLAHSPHNISNAYFLLFPSQLQIPMLFLAMCATLIASQAVIAGAFSLTRQAVRLGFLPPMLVRHTSRDEEGQVYIGGLNWLLFAAVLALVIVFGSSTRLAAAFGMAVSGTLLIDTILFLLVMRFVWKQSLAIVVVAGLLFLPLDAIFLTSGLSKFVHGGWIPILVAAIAYVLLTTWTKGHTIVSRTRHDNEETLHSFIAHVHHLRTSIVRAPGVAVYLSHHNQKAPMALHATVTQLHELSKRVVIVVVKTADIPHIPVKSRIVTDNLGSLDDGISQITMRFGYNDVPNIPLMLTHARQNGGGELDFDPYDASYFVSDTKITMRRNHHMSSLRKLLFIVMDRNAASPSDYYRLPANRTIDIAAHIEI